MVRYNPELEVDLRELLWEMHAAMNRAYMSIDSQADVLNETADEILALFEVV